MDPEPRTEAGRAFLDDWAPRPMDNHEQGCADCEGVIATERAELAARIVAIEDDAARSPEPGLDVLPNGWALTITYHPTPENRWIASAWNFAGGVSKGIVEGFGRTEDEARASLRAALSEPPR